MHKRTQLLEVPKPNNHEALENSYEDNNHIYPECASLRESYIPIRTDIKPQIDLHAGFFNSPLRISRKSMSPHKGPNGRTIERRGSMPLSIFNFPTARKSIDKVNEVESVQSDPPDADDADARSDVLIDPATLQPNDLPVESLQIPPPRKVSSTLSKSIVLSQHEHSLVLGSQLLQCNKICSINIFSTARNSTATNLNLSNFFGKQIEPKMKRRPSLSILSSVIVPSSCTKQTLYCTTIKTVLYQPEAKTRKQSTQLEILPTLPQAPLLSTQLQSLLIQQKPKPSHKTNSTQTILFEPKEQIQVSLYQATEPSQLLSISALKNLYSLSPKKREFFSKEVQVSPGQKSQSTGTCFEHLLTNCQWTQTEISKEIQECEDQKRRSIESTELKKVVIAASEEMNKDSVDSDVQMGSAERKTHTRDFTCCTDGTFTQVAEPVITFSYLQSRVWLPNRILPKVKVSTASATTDHTQQTTPMLHMQNLGLLHSYFASTTTTQYKHPMLKLRPHTTYHPQLTIVSLPANYIANQTTQFEARKMEEGSEASSSRERIVFVDCIPADTKNEKWKVAGQICKFDSMRSSKDCLKGSAVLGPICKVDVSLDPMPILNQQRMTTCALKPITVYEKKTSIDTKNLQKETFSRMDSPKAARNQVSEKVVVAKQHLISNSDVTDKLIRPLTSDDEKQNLRPQSTCLLCLELMLYLFKVASHFTKILTALIMKASAEKFQQPNAQSTQRPLGTRPQRPEPANHFAQLQNLVLDFSETVLERTVRITNIKKILSNKQEAQLQLSSTAKIPSQQPYYTEDSLRVLAQSEYDFILKFINSISELNQHQNATNISDTSSRRSSLTSNGLPPLLNLNTIATGPESRVQRPHTRR